MRVPKEKEACEDNSSHREGSPEGEHCRSVVLKATPDVNRREVFSGRRIKSTLGLGQARGHWGSVNWRSVMMDVGAAVEEQ